MPSPFLSATPIVIHVAPGVALHGYSSDSSALLWIWRLGPLSLPCAFVGSA